MSLLPLSCHCCRRSVWVLDVPTMALGLEGLMHLLSGGERLVQNVGSSYSLRVLVGGCLTFYRDMGAGSVTILAILVGTRRRVIASVDIPSTERWQMSSPERTFIGAFAPGVSEMVVLCCRVVVRGGILPSRSAVGRQKCFQIGHITEVNIWPSAPFWFPCPIHRKQDRGQSQPQPLCLLLFGQLKWWSASWCAPPHLLQTTRSLCWQQQLTVCPRHKQRKHWERRGRASQLQMVTSLPNIPTQDLFISSRPSPFGLWKEKVIEDACLSEARSLSGLNSHCGVANGRRPTNMGFQHSSSKSIFGDASLPLASYWRQTPLIRIDWYLAVGAARQFGLKGLKRMESYLVMSEKLTTPLKVRIEFL